VISELVVINIVVDSRQSVILGLVFSVILGLVFSVILGLVFSVILGLVFSVILGLDPGITKHQHLVAAGNEVERLYN